MPDWSRRSALHAVASAGALLLAGCDGTTSRSGTYLHEDREQVTEFDTMVVRDGDGEPLVVTDDGDPDDGTRDEPSDVRAASLMEHLTDDEALEGLRFRDRDGASALESFVTATDFDERSVYLLQQSIAECYVPRLVGVFRESDGVDAQFCRQLRPAGAECDADAHDAIVVAIRLPFAGDGFNSVGSGWSSDCDHRPSVPLSERGDAA